MITPYSGAIPDKATMDKDTFANSINPYLTYIDDTFVPEVNALETNVNAKEASAVYSADIATSAADYQGEWVSQGYALGQSVSYGGTTYMCKLTHVTGFAVTNTTYWQPTGIASIISGLTSKTTPVDADLIGIVDSDDSNVLKKLTFANLKAWVLSFLATNNQSFSAYAGTTQILATNTTTKININTEVFDTASAYDATTNYRFQPTVEGYYQLNAQVFCTSSATITRGRVLFFRNATSAVSHTGDDIGNNGLILGVSGSTIMYLNGSTDYVEIYANMVSAGTINTTISGENNNRFSGSLIRGA